jgi:hypothetical protein
MLVSSNYLCKSSLYAKPTQARTLNHARHQGRLFGGGKTRVKTSRSAHLTSREGKKNQSRDHENPCMPHSRVWPALVANIYNPSYSGGRDQEDPDSKPVPGKWFMRPYLQNTQHKNSWWNGSSGRVPA